ncbi:MAG: hypothetical protein HQL50_08990 [Magnetococcales bacterium]|nr:hypothetical protein [Magnetococcales bacterium]
MSSTEQTDPPSPAARTGDHQHRTWWLITLLALLLILVAGWLVRLHALDTWSTLRDRTFHQEAPLLTGLDSYLYLNLAHQWQQSNYDRHRAEHPAHLTYAPTHWTPLPSILIATVASISALDLRWPAALAGPFLGPLLAIPLFLLGWRLGGRMAGLVATAAGFFPFYLSRTSVGWFDTDLLNVTLLLSLVVLAIALAETASERKRLSIALTMAGFLFITVWWWQSAALEMTAIYLWLITMAWVVSRRSRPVASPPSLSPPYRQHLFWGGVLSLPPLISLATVGYESVANILSNGLWGAASYVAGVEQGLFPNPSTTISELQAPTLEMVAVSTIGSPVALVLALIGLALLLLQRSTRRLVPFLLPIFVLGAYGFLSKRFLLFTAPVLALGMATLVHLLFTVKGESLKKRAAWFAGILVIASCVIPLFKPGTGIYRLPDRITPHTATNMADLGAMTPKNAILWSWWDAGFPLRYWSQRQVAADGFVHLPRTGEHLVHLAFPLTSSDPRQAANFMRFYARHGLPGVDELRRLSGEDPTRSLSLLKQWMAAGPERTRSLIKETLPTLTQQQQERLHELLFPEDAPPVYLYLSGFFRHTVHWWSWFGSWQPDQKRGHHRVFVNIHTDQPVTDTIETPTLTADLKTGWVHILREEKKTAPLYRLLRHDGQRLHNKQYGHPEGFTLVWFDPLNQGVLMEEAILESLFTRLYFLNNVSDRYFVPVSIRGLQAQLWRVNPDPDTP